MVQPLVLVLPLLYVVADHEVNCALAQQSHGDHPTCSCRKKRQGKLNTLVSLDSASPGFAGQASAGVNARFMNSDEMRCMLSNSELRPHAGQLSAFVSQPTFGGRERSAIDHYAQRSITS